jgi:heat-inducible transcriptional repressor
MQDKDLNSRRDKIFDLIVRFYIETAEPVGSRTISKRYQVGLSPASIRNVMSDLEEEGLIMQPHTSAGRVPTDKGYRYYVDRLMEPEEPTDEEKGWIHAELTKARTVEGLMEKVSKVISELTGSAALIYVKNLKRVSFLNYLLDELIQAQKLASFLEEEPEIFVEGAFRIFEQPEFQDIRKMRLLLQAFDEKYELLRLLVEDLEEEGVQVHIGRENKLGELEDVSLVVKDYYVGRTPIGGVAAVGPTRMNYSKVVPIVEFVADTMTEAMQRF